MTISASAVLASSANLSPHERIARVVHVVRGLAQDDKSSFIAELDNQGRDSEDGQYFAAIAALAAKDSNWIRAHLTDPVERIQRMALVGAGHYPHLVSDETIETAVLGDLSYFARKALLLSRVVTSRPQLVEKLLTRVRTVWGGTVAVLLIPACSATTVAHFLPELLPFVRSGFHWSRLARTHPTVLFEALDRDLHGFAQRGLLAITWWKHYGSGLAVLVKQTHSAGLVHKVFDLLESTTEGDYFPQAFRQSQCLATLGRVDPMRLLRYVTCGRLSLRDFSRQTKKRIVRKALGTDELVKVARQADSLVWDFGPHVFPYMPLSARGAFISSLGFTESKHDTMLIDESNFEVPLSQRAAAARRLLRDPELDDNIKMKCCGSLPYGDTGAQKAISDAMRKSDGDLRAEGYMQRAVQGRRSGDPAILASLLQEVAGRLTNESPTVRVRVIESIIRGEYPPGVWSADALAALKKIAVDSVQAPDRTPYVSDSFASFVVTIVLLLGYHQDAVAWGKEMFETFKVRGLPSFSKFPPGSEAAVWTMAKPQILSSVEKQDYEPLVSFLKSMGVVRFEKVAELESLVPELVHGARTGSEEDKSNKQQVDELLKLYLGPKASRLRRLTRLLHHDSSIVTFGWVADLVARNLPEILVKVLAVPPRGRYLKDKAAARWVLPCSSRALRGISLCAIGSLRDQMEKAVWRTESGPERGHLIQRLGKIWGGKQVILSYVVKGLDGMEDTRTFEQALKTLDLPEHLELLVSFASTDHARVAMPTARRAVGKMSPSAFKPPILSILNATNAKVTSCKMAVRIVTEQLPLQEVVEIFQNQLANNNTHRDVMAAIVACTRLYLLETEGAWSILNDVLAPLPEEDARSDEEDPLGSTVDAGSVNDADSATRVSLAAKARVEDLQLIRIQIIRAQPLDVPSRFWERYARLVTALAGSMNDDVASEALKGLPSWALFNWTSAQHVLEEIVSGRINHSIPIRKLAADALVSLCYIPDAERVTCSVVATLLRADDDSSALTRWHCPSMGLLQHIVKKLGPKSHSGQSAVVSLHAMWVCAKTMLRVSVRPNQVTCKLLTQLIDINRFVTKPVIPENVPRTFSDLVEWGDDPPDSSVIIAALGYALAPAPGLLRVLTDRFDHEVGYTAYDIRNEWDRANLAAFFDWLQSLTPTHALLSFYMIQSLTEEDEEPTLMVWRRPMRKLRRHPSDDVSALAHGLMGSWDEPSYAERSHHDDDL